MSSHTPHQRSRYPYLWSVQVVENFVTKYSRATCYLAKVLDVDGHDLFARLVKLLMYAPETWNRVRDCIKYIDKHDMYHDIDAMEPRHRRDYLTFVSLECQEREKNWKIPWDLLDGSIFKE